MRSLVKLLLSTWCVLLFLLPVSWLHAAPSENIESDFEFKIPSSVESDETGKRKTALETNVISQVKLGDRLMQRRKFKDAYIAYERGIKIVETAKIGKSEYLNSTIKQIQIRSDAAKKAWAEESFEKARKQYLRALVEKNPKTSVKLLESAKNAAEKTLGPYYCGAETASPQMIQEKIRKKPAYYDNVQAFMKDCDKMIEAYQFKEASSLESVDPDYNRRQTEINYQLRQAEILYKTGQYEKLRNVLEKVLVSDQYNQKAINLLNKAYRKLYQIGAARADNDAIERVAEVEWKWNEQIPPEKDSIALVPQQLSGKKAILYDKLQKIIIDKIDFKGISVESALSHLNKISKQLDPDKLGVAIQPPNTPEEKSKKINFLHLERLPLLDVIRYVCDLTGLNYRIEEDTVFVGNVKMDSMEFASFDISRNLAGMIANEANPSSKEDKKDDSTEKISDAEGFSDKTLGEAKKDKETVNWKPPTQEQLKEYFGKALFPEGSKVDYDSKSGKLLVTNTPMNLRKLEFLLKELDCESLLVLIDSKIMEVKMNDLEQLGFDWLLTFNPQESSQNVYFNGSPTDLAAKQTVINTSNFMTSSSENQIVKNLNLIPNLGGSKFFDLSVSITAVDQMDRSEVLSTPRLLVKDGVKGQLKVDQERFFPDDWSEGEVEVINGNAYTYNAPTPEFGDGTALGTEFSVTPQVSPNNYTILLQLTTSVTQFTGWSSYDYSIVIGGLMTSMASVDTKTPKMKMPEFSKRKVENTVKIYDGETVVIGGIMQDETSRNEDKWPLLGEVPLIGRLFSNFKYKTEKTNLMIFVTARLMKGNGVPVHDARKQGLFEFGDR